MAKFLRNIWYAAAHLHELKADFVKRTICNEPIVMFRKSDGTLAALQDRCPHRFVPLSLGKRVGDMMMCGYHGLRFAADGSCAELPFEGDVARPDIRVASYPLVERHGVAWIWMGDTERADPDLIPDFSHLTDPAYVSGFGYTHMRAHYQAIADNLLDLSHVYILHPGVHDGSTFADCRNELRQDGDTIWSMLWRPHHYLDERKQQQYGIHAAYCEGQGHSRWDAPGLLLVYLAFWEKGSTIDQGVRMPSTHLLTPETETTSHYFWAVSRTFDLENEALTRMTTEQLSMIFETQDGLMLEAQQAAMGEETDLLALRPAILMADKAGLAARRVIKRLLRAEAGREKKDGPAAEGARPRAARQTA